MTDYEKDNTSFLSAERQGQLLRQALVDKTSIENKIVHLEHLIKTLQRELETANGRIAKLEERNKQEISWTAPADEWPSGGFRRD